MEGKIYKLISKYNNIVIARHIGPDPDAVASQIALRDAIKLTFSNKNVYAVGASVARFKSYGLLDRIDVESLDNPLLIVLDVPNLNRIDGVDYTKFKEIIKIDHHPYEDKMGKLEIVDTSVASACELVARLIFKTKLKMDKSIASNLYLGMVADSDRFLLSTTSSATFEIATKLLKDYNLDLKSLYNIIYERPINEFRFQAYLALNMTVTENGFAYIKITNDMIKEFGVDSGTASNMVNNFNFIKDVYVWAFASFDERLEIFKVNIRSRGPVINEVASKYNGGGHPLASGARIKDMDDVDKLLNELDNVCLNHKNSMNQMID